MSCQSCGRSHKGARSCIRARDTFQRDTFPQAGKFGWQNGYTAFTVSKSQAVKVATYIRNQKQHHLKTGSVDELKMLLRAHGVDFDEKYL